MKNACAGQMVISKAVVEAAGRPRPGAGQDILVLCRWPGHREDRANIDSQYLAKKGKLL